MFLRPLGPSPGPQCVGVPTHAGGTRERLRWHPAVAGVGMTPARVNGLVYPVSYTSRERRTGPAVCGPGPPVRRRRSPPPRQPVSRTRACGTVQLGWSWPRSPPSHTHPRISYGGVPLEQLLCTRAGSPTERTEGPGATRRVRGVLKHTHSRLEPVPILYLAGNGRCKYTCTRVGFLKSRSTFSRTINIHTKRSP